MPTIVNGTVGTVTKSQLEAFGVDGEHLAELMALFVDGSLTKSELAHRYLAFDDKQTRASALTLVSEVKQSTFDELTASVNAIDECRYSIKFFVTCRHGFVIFYGVFITMYAYVTISSLSSSRCVAISLSTSGCSTSTPSRCFAIPSRFPSQYVCAYDDSITLFSITVRHASVLDKLTSTINAIDEWMKSFFTKLFKTYVSLQKYMENNDTRIEIFARTINIWRQPTVDFQSAQVTISTHAQ